MVQRWDVFANSEGDLYSAEPADLIPGSRQLVWYNIGGSGSRHRARIAPSFVRHRGIRNVALEGDRLWYNDPERRYYHRWNGSEFVEQRVALSELWPAKTKIVHYWLEQATQKVQFEPAKLDLRVGDLVGLVQKGDRFLEVIRPGGPFEWDENHELKATGAGTSDISISAKFTDARNDARIPVHIEP